MYIGIVFVFVFKQKSAYEMRISDWSSDVCSSDLKAISLDVTSLNVATVSYKIADAWSEAVTSRGMDEWQCAVWPEQKMAVISPPNLIGADYPVMFISNKETGTWARFTNWYALCMTVFDGRLFFGSPSGERKSKRLNSSH